MPAEQLHAWFHSNRYTADATCEYCNGVNRHEPWCITRNPHVLNAWEAVLDPAKLDPRDRLILHALGVSWQGSCALKCNSW